MVSKCRLSGSVSAGLVRCVREVPIGDISQNALSHRGEALEELKACVGEVIAENRLNYPEQTRTSRCGSGATSISCTNFAWHMASDMS